MIDLIPERYRVRIRVDPESGCWLWLGAKTSKGRGCIRFCGHTITTHKFFFEMLVGPVPDGMDLHHKCKVKHCCNPDHLGVKTRLEHRREHPRPTPTHCLRGHAYTPENIRKSKNGWHSCRICFNEAQLKRYHEKKHA